MHPYRDQNIETLKRQMAEAMCAELDAEQLHERAKAGADESERRLAEARCRRMDATDAYKKARWP